MLFEATIAPHSVPARMTLGQVSQFLLAFELTETFCPDPQFEQEYHVRVILVNRKGKSMHSLMDEDKLRKGS